MNFKIVTGLSGAGKSQAIKAFEDKGYYCVDNLPPQLFEKFAELFENSLDGINNIAMGIDIRGGEFFENIFMGLENLKIGGHDVKIIYLEADDPTLVKRFKESRRSHPMAQDRGILEGIAKEKEKMKFIREKADYIINTSNLNISEFKQRLNIILEENNDSKSLRIYIKSFGFKNGIPLDADMVFDTRFLPNPYYVRELKKFTGNDAVIREYVMSFEESREYYHKIKNIIKFMVPFCDKEGRNQLIIAIGCTGGHHRSVTFANELSRELSSEGFNVKLHHREIDKI
jgi:UPF0042 nucleotide-binding protein